MIIALAGYYSGYDGSFEFKEPGVPYGDAEYMGMRTVTEIAYFAKTTITSVSLIPFSSAGD